MVKGRKRGEALAVEGSKVFMAAETRVEAGSGVRKS
jgi:hypothetical protein